MANHIENIKITFEYKGQASSVTVPTATFISDKALVAIKDKVETLDEYCQFSREELWTNRGEETEYGVYMRDFIPTIMNLLFIVGQTDENYEKVSQNINDWEA